MSLQDRLISRTEQRYSPSTGISWDSTGIQEENVTYFPKEL